MPPQTPVVVAIAVLVQDQRWLLQLRDDDPAIVAPGCWGLFGGHLEPRETPLEALSRELQEEIGHVPSGLQLWYRSTDPSRIRHVFHASLRLPLSDLRLAEGQDLVLAEVQTIASGLVWSPRLQEHRPLAPSLLEALGRWQQEAGAVFPDGF
ncbi:MAG: NUDIX hydrolase [Synechococcus sp. ELA057]